MSRLVTMEYIDLMTKLVNRETSCFVIENAYIANGFVFIKGGIKAGVDFSTAKLLPEKYAPYSQQLATVHYTNTSGDNGKVQTLTLQVNGDITGWVRKLDYYEPFTFMYPLAIK